MKRIVFILTTFLAFNAYADEPTIVAETNPNDATTKCGDNCTWKLYSNGKLEISGTGDMYNYERYDTGVALWEGTHGYQSKAPWGAYSANIQTIDIQNGITSIGKACFYNTIVSEVNLPDSITTLEELAFKYAANLTEISLPNNLTNIGENALSQTMIENFVIPESVTFIGTHAFGSNALQNITIEGNITLEKNMLWNNSGTISTTLENIYCLSSNESCNALKTDTDIGSKITSYTKEAGVYRLEDGTIFSSPNDMMNGTNACTDLDTCKATVLQNKGYCTGEVCGAMVAAENGNHPIEYNNKSYASIDDLLKGKHMPKRIYTVDEANQVAGKVNSVKIRYR